MDQLPKTSLNYYLSEYLADLQRAGVQDFPRGADVNPRVGAAPRSGGVPFPSSNRASGSQPPRQPQARVAPIESRASASSSDSSSSSSSDSPRPISTKPIASGDDRIVRLQTIAAEVAQCEQCAELVANRTQTVFGTGDPHAELVFIGEGPGAEEDLRGEPFVGRSGKLLTDMIEKGMGLSRSDVFICNIVRCRPPGNRNPSESEARACRRFLDATLDVVQPKFICCLGAVAATNLLETTEAMARLRGNVYEYKGAQVVCTYHPAYLLRNPSAKKDAWHDLQLLMKLMGLELPTQRRSN